ncbi:unnamed protein product [Ascophyllum nodosum]
MERKITSSVPAPARRYRRAITPKPSRRITARCGVLMVAGIFTFVMVFEFILIHRHKPHNSITNSKGPLRESSKGDADSPSRGDTFLPKPTGERRESTFAASPPHAVFNSSGPNIGHVDLLPPRLTTKPEDYPDDGTIVDNGSQQGEDCYGGMRVAVLVPYSGPGLPLWFDSFVELAAASKDAVDWIIFCEEELALVQTPPNVRMFATSSMKLAWLLAGIVYPEDADDRPEEYVSDYHDAMRGNLPEDQQPARNERFIAAKFIQKLLAKNPYYMVEFKPTLGWVFRDYLKGYTHWAYGDLDVLFGDLTKGWLEPREMRDFDIITYSFGDQERAYLRGQLTVHKINPKVNHLWRGCSHLSNYTKRIEMTYETRRYNLESAEGCYSMVVMMSKDVKVKYAVKVFTDMPGGGHERREEVVITGEGIVKRCPARLRRRGDVLEPEYGTMQEDVGEEWPAQVTQESCEYWISSRFQTCLQIERLSNQTPNVFLHDGKYYARGYVNLWKEKAEEGCSLGAFHHFQNFKANYKAWNTRPPMPPVHRGLVARRGGIVPLPNGDWRSMAVNPEAPPPENRGRFTHRYCLLWEPIVDKEMSYSSTCEASATEKDVRTLYDSRPADGKGEAAVTLGAVGSLRDLEGVLKSFWEWRGPKVLVLVLSTAEAKEAYKTLKDEEKQRQGLLNNTYVKAFLVPTSQGNDILNEMPRKALLNALGDSCRTRHLLTLAQGFRLARGVETAVLEALKTPSEEPRVLVVPQWCLNVSKLKDKGEVPSLSLEDLRRRRLEGSAGLCHLSPKAGENHWLGNDVADKFLDAGAVEAVISRRRANEISEETRIKNGLALLRSDVVSPVLVVDLWSAPALFLRHMEEVTRLRCFDGAYARGLWAAGFEFHLIPDAAVFAETVPAYRSCRNGAQLPMTGYTSFLEDVRRVYSKYEPHPDVDNFKIFKEDRSARPRRSKSSSGNTIKTFPRKTKD